MDYAYALGCLRGVISIAEELGDSSIPISVLEKILASFAIKEGEYGGEESKTSQ